MCSRVKASVCTLLRLHCILAWPSTYTRFVHTRALKSISMNRTFSCHTLSDDVVSVSQETSFKYFLALDISSSSSSSSPFFPNTLVIADGDIQILSENFHHPPPRDLPSPSKRVLQVPQFLVKRTINVTEVANITLLGRTINPGEKT